MAHILSLLECYISSGAHTIPRELKNLGNVFVCACVRMHVCMHVCVCAYTCVYVCVCVHMCLSAYVCAHVCVYGHV